MKTTVTCEDCGVECDVDVKGDGDARTAWYTAADGANSGFAADVCPETLEDHVVLTCGWQ